MVFDVIRQVVILVGGRGTRLGKHTCATPKPLLPIADGRPFLDYLLESVARHGYEEILLLAGYLGDKIENAYAGRQVGGASVRVLREFTPLGTGGALTLARNELDPMFLMMNGDALFDINLRALEETARKAGTKATLALRTVPDGSRYGRVTEQAGRITAFHEKDTHYTEPCLINGGVYVLKREILECINSLPCSIEQDVFPRLVSQNDISGSEFKGYFLDIGLPESLAQGHAELPCIRFKPAVFLDWNILVHKVHEHSSPVEILDLEPDVSHTIRRLNDLNYYIFCIAHQSETPKEFSNINSIKQSYREIQYALFIHGAHLDNLIFIKDLLKHNKFEHNTASYNLSNGSNLFRCAIHELPVLFDKSFYITSNAIYSQKAYDAGLDVCLYRGENLSDLIKKYTLK